MSVQLVVRERKLAQHPSVTISKTLFFRLRLHQSSKCLDHCFSVDACGFVVAHLVQTLQEVAGKLKSDPEVKTDIAAFPVEIADDKSVAQLAKDVVARFGTVDILVNSQGQNVVLARNGEVIIIDQKERDAIVVAAITTVQLDGLTSGQLGDLTTTQFQVLTTTQLGSLTSTQIKKSKMLMSALASVKLKNGAGQPVMRPIPPGEFFNAVAQCLWKTPLDAPRRNARGMNGEGRSTRGIRG